MITLEKFKLMNINELNDKDATKLLKEHFELFYKIATEAKISEDAAFSKNDLMTCAYSGIPSQFFNAIIETNYNNIESKSDDIEDKDCDKNIIDCIDQQINYFAAKKVPFMWLAQQKQNQLEQCLKDKSFSTIGKFSGMAARIDGIKPLEIPKEIIVKNVETDEHFKDFVDIIKNNFNFDDVVAEGFFKLSRYITSDEFLKIHKNKIIVKNYLAYYKPDNENTYKPASTLTVLCSNGCMSIWNGSTLAPFRKKGICSVLGNYALIEAKELGCTIGCTYLMPEAMALHLCDINSRYKGKTFWEFNAYKSPQPKL